MIKIPFEDGIKLKNATVTIEGQEYEVTPAQYTGTTPMSAFNLNKMQDNIETAIEEIVNKIYSVGSIIIKSTNENPANNFGGEWELIDKEFISVSSTSGGFNLDTSNAKDNLCYYTRAGHTITFELRVTNITNLSDTTLDLGNLDFEVLGINKLDGSQRITGYSDGGNCCIMFNITQTGLVQVVDIIPESSMTSNQLNVTFTFTVTKDKMLDSACGKFFWKRIA